MRQRCRHRTRHVVGARTTLPDRTVVVPPLPRLCPWSDLTIAESRPGTNTVIHPAIGQPPARESCWRTHAGSGLVCGRPATTTVGTVSLPSLAALTAAAPSGSRQMLTQCTWRAPRPRRMRRRRQNAQPGRQKTTGRPSAALRRRASDALIDLGKIRGEFTTARATNTSRDATAVPGFPLEVRPVARAAPQSTRTIGRIQARVIAAKAIGVPGSGFADYGLTEPYRVSRGPRSLDRRRTSPPPRCPRYATYRRARGRRRARPGRRACPG